MPIQCFGCRHWVHDICVQATFLHARVALSVALTRSLPIARPERRSNPQLFDDVNVYGDIKGSDIHHMYYGMYSYGHQGGVWINNKMHDNIIYGEDTAFLKRYATKAKRAVIRRSFICVLRLSDRYLKK